MTYFCIGIFLLPFLKLKIWDMTYFCIGIFILKTWGDVTYLQTRDDTSIKAPLRRQTICQICHKSAAFRFCRILLGIFHICGDIFFWIKKVWFAWFCWCCFLPSIFSQFHFKRLEILCKKNRQSQKSCIATAGCNSGSESMDGMGEAPARSCGNQRFTSPNKSPPPTVLQCTTRPQ